MISVIIPAHNEELVIARSLQALLDGARQSELEIIVVCNGCTDMTAAVAGLFGPAVRVIETQVPSKIHALNLGDAAASGFPRFYVDADVLLPLACLRPMAETLQNKNILAVAPRFQMDLQGCSWAVRAFYDINGRLPSSREGIGGSGVYGLSEAGRRRFDHFPAVTADDGFVRIQFHPGERQTLDTAHSTVFAPRRLKDLIAIKTRSHFGTTQLRRQYPELWPNKGQGNNKALLGLLAQPMLWPEVTVYVYVKSVVRFRSRRLRHPDNASWQRDSSSRLNCSLSGMDMPWQR